MIAYNNILFLDIETVSQYRNYDELPEGWKELWNRKAEGLIKHSKEETTIEEVYDCAAFFAEFGKIICISCGILQGNSDNKSIVVKSFYGHDEKKLLGDFCDMLSKWSPGSQKWLCAHNGKEFDFPYLCRRMVINNECIPALLSISGKKPWEMNLIDTLELWKFGEYKNFTSLNL